MKESFDEFFDKYYDRFMWTDSLNNQHVFCAIEHHVLIGLARAILNEVYKDINVFDEIIKIPEGGLNINDIVLDYAIPAKCLVTEPTDEWDGAYLGTSSRYIVGIYQAGKYTFPEPIHSQILNMVEPEV